MAGAKKDLQTASAREREDFASRDIAFKPTTDGWGYTASYASGWDRIFSKAPREVPPPPPPAPAPEAAASFEAKMAALEEARRVGAISGELYARAREELASLSGPPRA